MTPPLSPHDDDAATTAIRWSYAILLGLLVLYAAIAVGNQTFLYSDGAHQFILALLEPRFDRLIPEDLRDTANALVRLPMWTAMRLGVTDLGALQALYGAGIFLHYMLMVWICARAAGARRELMLFPLASFFLVSANISFMAWSPSHLLVSVFWAQLYVLLLPQRWSTGWMVLSLILAVVALAAYESMVVFGWVLALVAAWRAWTEVSTRYRATAATVAILSLVGVAKAFFSIMERVEHFTRSSVLFLDPSGRWHGTALLSLATLVLLATVNLRSERIWRAGFLATLGGWAAWLVVNAIRPDLTSVAVHYEARPLNLWFTLIILGLFLIAVLNGRSRTMQSWRKAWLALTIAGVMQSAWFVLLASHWNFYIHLIAAETQLSAGLRRFEDTRLDEVLVENHPVNAFMWSWVNPTLSILVSPDGNVRSIIANPEWYQGWQPFDPRDPEALPPLQRFGVGYDGYLAALRSTNPGVTERPRGNSR